MRFPHFATTSLVLCTLAPAAAFAQPASAPPAGPAAGDAGNQAPEPVTLPDTVSGGLIIHHTPVDPPNESNVDYFWRKSDDAFHAGDYPRAVQLHRAIVVLDPADIDSYGVASWLLWSMGKTQDANDFLNQGLKANPKDPDMWDTAAQQYDLEKETGPAEDAYAKAVSLADVKLGNDNDMLRRRYAHAMEHNGHLRESQPVWEALAKDYPNDPVVLHNLERVKRSIATGATSTGPGPAPAAPPAMATQ